MALSLEDFAAFEASWDSKVDALRRIAATLNVGLDSIVFFDDNPAEREHVRQALPEVWVVDVPSEPADYVRALEETLAFETVALTADDRRRSEQYAVERQRKAAAAESVSVDDYLESLEMVGTLRPIDGADLPRVAQLLGKTNQFNLTTRRHGAVRIQQLLEEPGAIGFSLRLRDRFGDHGLVGVLIAVPADASSTNDGARTLVVDTLLMSCRVIGRTAEHLIVQHLLDQARAGGFTVVRGEFIRTAKNALVAGFWESMGFTRVASSTDVTGADGAVAYELRLATAPALRSFVQPERQGMSVPA
jgi:FkbH-like protein